MKKIGITGGIGSGKTTVCEIFKLLGIAVFHADDEAKYLQNNDLQVKDQLIGLFGEHIYSPYGMLDRNKLADVIFNDSVALAKVNAIIHPAVRKHFNKWVDRYSDQPYVLYEAAILFESGHATDFDKNILVLADKKLRIERVIRRDNISEEQVKQRITNQMPDRQKIKMADFLIINNDEELLLPQIIELDKTIKKNDKNW